MSDYFSVTPDGSGPNDLAIDLGPLVVRFTIDQEVISSMDDSVHPTLELGHLCTYRQAPKLFNFSRLIKDEVDLIGDPGVMLIETS